MKCELCGKEIDEGQANNGEPLVKGMVCGACNWKVIQERLRRLRNQPKVQGEAPAQEAISDRTQEDFQSSVNSDLRKYGRVGGGLYDELDQAGFYLDSNNKVQSKTAKAEESMAVIGTGGPVNTTDPMADFEEYAKKFKEMFILGETPVRKEKAENKTKVKDGVVVGEVSSMAKAEKNEQVKPLEKSATEGVTDEDLEHYIISIEEQLNGLSGKVTPENTEKVLNALRTIYDILEQL